MASVTENRCNQGNYQDQSELELIVERLGVIYSKGPEGRKQYQRHTWWDRKYWLLGVRACVHQVAEMGGSSMSRRPRVRHTKIQTIKIDDKCAMFCARDDFDAQRHLEESAAQLSNIQPHHWVLALDFGKGHGLIKALERIKDGTGKICGTETSLVFVNKARNLYEFEMAELKLEINHTAPNNIPYMRNTFERVFLVNVFPDWDDLDSCLQEIYRVMRPGCYMVTCYSRYMTMKPSKQGTKSSKHSLETYVEALKENAFVRIKIEEHRHGDTGFKYHAIYAHTRKRK